MISDGLPHPMNRRVQDLRPRQYLLSMAATAPWTLTSHTLTSPPSLTSPEHGLGDGDRRGQPAETYREEHGDGLWPVGEAGPTRSLRRPWNCSSALNTTLLNGVLLRLQLHMNYPLHVRQNRRGLMHISQGSRAPRDASVCSQDEQLVRHHRLLQVCAAMSWGAAAGGGPARLPCLPSTACTGSSSSRRPLLGLER